MNREQITTEITIKGLVQGIGYRPFVAYLAKEMKLAGHVRNTDGIVTVVVQGDASAIEIFKERLLSEAPGQAKVTQISCREIDSEEQNLGLFNAKEFVIEESNTSGDGSIPYIPPDIATCNACEKELFDIANRRYRHPFISCTDCGPRYSILENLPYDRPRLVMKKFPMCLECGKEYTSSRDIIPGNRRQHAQTIACRDCGPRLRLWIGDGDYGADICRKNARSDDEILKEAILGLKSGKIVAVMDIGGFHLAALATDDGAIKRLREIKRRTRKPFAVMFCSTDEVRKHAYISPDEARLLESSARPVVLVGRKDDGKAPCDISDIVCENSPYIGAMLPCNPLQMILAADCGSLVMTSANISGDLMITEPKEMIDFSKKNGGDIMVIYHDRPVLTPLDDSVVQLVAGRQQIIRRARGYVPEPVFLQKNIKKDSKPIFAAGGDMKATFGYYEDGKAVLSQPFGDMETEEIQIAYTQEKDRMKKLFGFNPKHAVFDAHPGYFTARLSTNSDMPATQKVYHHHAHAASVIAEHGIEGDVLCLAFDGTGYGEDGTVWGSEFFHWDGQRMRRFASLEPVRLLGGSEGVRNADVILAGFFDDVVCVGRDETESNAAKDNGTESNNADRNKAVISAINSGINTVTSSSMGRLFDAASALLDICHYSEYEGEAAIELEYAAAKAKKPYRLELPLTKQASEQNNNTIFSGNSRELIRQIKAATEENAVKSEIALGFIYAVADWAAAVVDTYNKTLATPIKKIALSGGTFQNRILTKRVIENMESRGYMVYTNEQVPPGDGGLALGQIFLTTNR